MSSFTRRMQHKRKREQLYARVRDNFSFDIESQPGQVVVTRLDGSVDKYKA